MHVLKFYESIRLDHDCPDLNKAKIELVAALGQSVEASKDEKAFAAFFKIQHTTTTKSLNKVKYAYAIEGGRCGNVAVEKKLEKGSKTNFSWGESKFWYDEEYNQKTSPKIIDMDQLEISPTEAVKAINDVFAGYKTKFQFGQVTITNDIGEPEWAFSEIKGRIPAEPIYVNAKSGKLRMGLFGFM